MSLFLTHNELVELTDRPRHKEQIAWLRANGYSFTVGAKGGPKVLRSFVNAMLGTTEQEATNEPDFTIFEGKANGKEKKHAA